MDRTKIKHEKFAAYFGQKNDYLFYVSVQREDFHQWIQVYQLDGTELVGLDFQRFCVDQIDSWLVAYPRTGEIVDGEKIFTPLPSGITEDIQKSLIEVPTFGLADLHHGRKIVEIKFAPSPTHPANSRCYSTLLKNYSNKKVKCLVFGAYTYSKSEFILNTVTGHPFTASQFVEWYGIGTHGWLLPGETACDPSNYGNHCYWIYYFQTEQGSQFHTGLEVGSKKGILSKIFGR